MKAAIVYLMVAAAKISVVIRELIRASKADFAEGFFYLDPGPTQAPRGHVVIHDISTDRAALPITRHSSF